MKISPTFSSVLTSPTKPERSDDWQLTTCSALHDAENLLDKLETKGVTERELLVLGNRCFAVRWRGETQEKSLKARVAQFFSPHLLKVRLKAQVSPHHRKVRDRFNRFQLFQKYIGRNI
jgi:hypothetical protein